MATIRYVTNVFEDKVQDMEFNKNSTLIKQIEAFATTNCYEDYMVEAYDSETGECFKTLLVDEYDPCVLIAVNGKIVDRDYEVKDDDVVLVCFLPLSGSTKQVQGGWLGGLIGNLSGSLAGALVGFEFGGWWGALIGASIGGTLGFITGFVSGWMIAGEIDSIQNNQKSKDSKRYSSDTQTGLADIRGAENAYLLGSNFPFVLGKKLVSPFIVGDPYVVYGYTQYVPREQVRAYASFAGFLNFFEKSSVDRVCHIIPTKPDMLKQKAAALYPWLADSSQIEVNPTNYGNSYTSQQAQQFCSGMSSINNCVLFEADWNLRNSDKLLDWSGMEYNIFVINKRSITEWISSHPGVSYGGYTATTNKTPTSFELYSMPLEWYNDTTKREWFYNNHPKARYASYNWCTNPIKVYNAEELWNDASKLMSPKPTLVLADTDWIAEGHPELPEWWSDYYVIGIYATY